MPRIGPNPQKMMNPVILSQRVDFDLNAIALIKFALDLVRKIQLN